jgi:hypothetical protein
MMRPGHPLLRPRRRLLELAAGCLLAAVPALALASRPPPAGSGRPLPAPPSLMGLSLGMPVEAAIRVVEAMAPKGSVTLPAMRRDTAGIVKIEVPASMAAPADEAAKDSNFYVMLNSAPRILKSQPTRSSHVPFVTLVYGVDDRRIVRIVFEPAFVYWPEGYDAAKRTAWSLVELLRERHSVPVELFPGTRTGQPPAPGGAGGGRPGRPEPTPAGWALRVNAERKSIVLTDVTRLQDGFASRLQLD